MFVVAVAKCLTAVSGEAHFRSQFQRHLNLRRGTGAPRQQEPVGEAPHMLVDQVQELPLVNIS